MFDIDILWCKERLPDYFTLIHGILMKDELDHIFDTDSFLVTNKEMVV